MKCHLYRRYRYAPVRYIEARDPEDGMEYVRALCGYVDDIHRLNSYNYGENLAGVVDPMDLDPGPLPWTVDLPTWRRLPRSAQCGHCFRITPVKYTATQEEITAVECALSGIAKAFS